MCNCGKKNSCKRNYCSPCFKPVCPSPCGPYNACGPYNGCGPCGPVGYTQWYSTYQCVKPVPVQVYNYFPCGPSQCGPCGPCGPSSCGPCGYY